MHQQESDMSVNERTVLLGFIAHSLHERACALHERTVLVGFIAQ